MGTFQRDMLLELPAAEIKAPKTNEINIPRRLLCVDIITPVTPL
jgi:hypothetical protein